MMIKPLPITINYYKKSVVLESHLIKESMELKNKSQSLRGHLIRSASGSLVLKLLLMVLQLLLSVVLARVLGVKEFGIYAFFLSIAQLLTIPAMMGGQQLLLREVASYNAKGDFNFMRGLLIRSRQASLVCSCLIIVLIGCIGSWICSSKGLQSLWPLYIALALVPFLALIQLQGATFRGLQHILIGQLGQVLRIALVLIVLSLVAWMTEGYLSSTVALTVQVGATAFLFCLFSFVLRHVLPKEAKTQPPLFETAHWAQSALPFVFAGAMQVLNNETSVVLLGFLQDAESVGLFRIAQRGASIITFGLMAANMAIGPTVAQLFAQAEKVRLQKVITKSVLAVMTFAAPVGLGIVAFGHWLLPSIFGADFAAAYHILVILCLGQFVNAATGSVGLVLNMTGLERFTAKGVGIAVTVSVILNLSLIPIFGAVGAAIATTISMVVRNLLMAIWLYRETGILSTVKLRT